MINIAGHRLGTREIEESISSYPNVAEVAVVGIKDALKGQVAVAFVIPKQSDTLADREAARRGKRDYGAGGQPDRSLWSSGACLVCLAAPKTRSGKMLRRTIRAICEGRDPGDLTTIDDPASLQQIRRAIEE